MIQPTFVSHQCYQDEIWQIPNLVLFAVNGVVATVFKLCFIAFFLLLLQTDRGHFTFDNSVS